MKEGYKFILQRDSGERIVVSSNYTDYNIEELLDLFTDFMRGCGYQVQQGEIVYEPWQSEQSAADEHEIREEEYEKYLHTARQKNIKGSKK